MRQPLPVWREIAIEVKMKPHDGFVELSQSQLHRDHIVPLDQAPHEVVLAIVRDVVETGCQAKSMDVIRVGVIPIPQGRELTRAVMEQRTVPKEVKNRLDILKPRRAAEPFAWLP